MDSNSSVGSLPGLRLGVAGVMVLFGYNLFAGLGEDVGPGLVVTEPMVG